MIMPSDERLQSPKEVLVLFVRSVNMIFKQIWLFYKYTGTLKVTCIYYMLYVWKLFFPFINITRATYSESHREVCTAC